MGITKKQIDNLDKIYDELDKLADKVSEAELLARQNKDVSTTIERDGKQVEVKEADLWNEYRYLGDKSDAGKYLREKYTDLFQKIEEYEVKKDELVAYSKVELGVNPLAMTLRDIIKLIRAIDK